MKLNEYEEKVKYTQNMNIEETIKEDLLNAIFIEKEKIEYEYVMLKYKKIIENDFILNLNY